MKLEMTQVNLWDFLQDYTKASTKEQKNYENVLNWMISKIKQPPEKIKAIFLDAALSTENDEKGISKEPLNEDIKNTLEKVYAQVDLFFAKKAIQENIEELLKKI